MSKHSNKDLFLLIRSLSKNEKGYVKKFSFQKKDTAHFLKLFDAIDKQTIYDEKSLIKNETYVKQLPRLKIYLYEYILTALDAYYANKNMDLLLRKILSRVYTLFERGLYDQCIKQLNKARYLAERHEKFEQLHEILQWERALTLEKLLVSDFYDIAKREKANIDLMINLSYYKNALGLISELYLGIIYVRNDAQRKQLEKIVSTPYFSSVSKALSIHAKILWYKTFAKYHAAMDNKKKFMEMIRSAVNVAEENKYFIEQNIFDYIKILNNLLATLSENGYDMEYEINLEKLRTLATRYPNAGSKKMRDILHLRVTWREYYHAMNKGEIELAFVKAKEMEVNIALFRNLISDAHHLMFRYQIAYMYFLMGDYKKALNRINEIINEPLKSEKIFFACLCKILYLFIHYELKNYNLISYQVKSVKQFLSKHSRLFEPEKTLVAFLAKLSDVGDEERQKKEIYAALTNRLDKLVKPEHSIIDEYFNSKAWAKGKLLKKPMKEILPNQE